MNPIVGHYVDSAVGFLPGERLADFWQFEEQKFAGLLLFPGREVKRNTRDGMSRFIVERAKC